MHGDVRGAGVTDDIRQGFLKDAEKSGVEVRMEARVTQAGVDVALDAGSSLEFVGLPLEGVCQAEVIKDAGAQLGGDALYHFDCRIDISLERARFFEQRLEIFFLGQFAANQ